MEIAASVTAENPGKTMVVEPNIKILPTQLDRAELVSMEGAAQAADVHVILVDHKEIKKHKFPELSSVLDFKGIFL